MANNPLSPKTDPAQRLLMECTYEALENAGIPRERIAGTRTGVFIGGNYGEHRMSHMRDLDTMPSFDATGNQPAFLSGRLAYYFNLHGPTFTVDTACSSSLHALHLAVQSIRNGESDSAVVGASHVITQPDVWVSMSMLRLFSDAGKTYAFDQRAKSGYARGEGCAVIILKPVEQALKDNDHIFSVITHSGISHNGRTVGIVAPSPDEQEQLLRDVFTAAKINPREVGFFEAHGTGTKKGDPIEATAIYNAVGRHFTKDDPLYIGSSKPNVGHLECASGLVSVIKGVLSLYYGFVLPNADFDTENPEIPFQKWNMAVAKQQRPWPANKKYACVNNFGFSGSNSTCILSGPPVHRRIELGEHGAYTTPRLFVLSANDEQALRTSIKELGIWLEQHAELYQTTMPRNLAYTLCQRRSHFPWRVSVVETICSGLAGSLNGHDLTPMRASSEQPRLAFIFTGQGAQWYAMGRELLQSHPVYLNSIKRADEALRKIGAEFSIYEELTRDKETTKVGQAHVSQPICSAVQLALVDLLDSFGVKPGAVTGHSSGEIGAAYAAGALSFEGAMEAAYYRGQMIVELKKAHPELKGSMLAVGAGAADCEPLLQQINTSESKAVVACENSPSSTTISGDEAAIGRVAELFQKKGTFNRKLFVDVAYHSPHMAMIADKYLQAVSHIQPPDSRASSTVEFYSSLHARRLASLSELGPSYWVDNLTQPVRFSTALQHLISDFRPDILLEVGPHAALKGPIMQTIKYLSSPQSAANMAATATKLTYLSVLDRSKSAAQSALEATGALFTHGYQGLNWFNINHNREEYERPDLVTGLYSYPWTRQSYWAESRIARQHRLKPFPRHDLLGVLADWSSDIEPTWRNVLSARDLPWLKDYAVQGQGQRRRMVFPASGFVSMVVEAAGQLHLMRREGHVGPEASKFEVRNLRVDEQLWLEDEDKEYEVLLTIRPGDDTGQPDSFRISSFEQSRGWQEHCTGFVKAGSASPVRRQPLGLSRARDQSHPKTVTFNDDDAVSSASSLDDGQSDSAPGSSSPKPASSSASDSGSINVEADGPAAQAQGSTTPETPPCSGHSTSAFTSLDKKNKKELQQKLEHAKSGTHPHHNLALHSTETIYSHLASSVGAQYPSDFQTLTEVTANENTAAANCLVRETKTEMPFQHETGYKTHPAILDELLQLPLLSLSAAGGGHDKTTGTSYLPAAIRHLTISSRLKKRAGQTFCVHSNVEDSSNKGDETSFMIEAFVSPGSATAAISIAGLQFDTLEAEREESGGPRELCFQVRWDELKSENGTDNNNKADNNTENKEPKDKPTRNVAIITETPNPNKSPLIKAVYNQIEQQTGKQARVSSLQNITDFSNTSFLVLSELDQPLVSSLSNTNSAAEQQLDQIKRLLTTSPGLLWVTRGATRFPTSPNSNMALGLLRTARSEASAVAAALDLDPESRLSAEQQANLIFQAFNRSVLSSSSSAASDENDAESAELEFAEEQGKLYVPRLEPDQQLNLEISRELGPSIPYTQFFLQDPPELNGLRQLELAPSQGPKGELDNLHFEDRPETVLKDDEVEILVAASAITLDDVDYIQQGASHRHSIARGCSGTVSRVGKGVHEVAVGANVCALAEGRFGTHARAKVTSVVPMSSRLTPEVGAGIPIYVARAYYALATIAHVKAGNKLMIQLSGPSSVAAVEVAKSLGADTWAYVTNDVEIEAARKLGFAEERVLDERSIYLRRKLDEATGGTGFDVILTVAGGRNEGESKAWQCLADFGRLIEIRASGRQSSRPQLGANASFVSIDMVSLAEGRPKLMHKTLVDVMHKLEKGEFQPPTKTHVYKVSELAGALEWVRGAVTVHPVVVAVGGRDQATYRKSRGIFRRDGTHIIIGGTGGLGRSMAKYMAEHGARNIVLLSRSGGGKDMVEQLEKEISCPDVNIRVKKCDASDERQVRELVKDCARELPSICGVIHAAMVLRDVLLESMSFSDFSQVVQPKVAGAWNVHNVLSDTGANLDYFVVLSSAAGILGSRGQGAYAAANTFLDSFVQYRVRNGLPATSLDLTAVSDAGYLAENAERQEDIMRNFGNETVSEQEVLALLSAAVRGVGPAQVLTGLKLHVQSDGSWPYYASDARFSQLKADSLAAAEREGLVPKAAASAGNAFRAAKTDEEAMAIAGQGILQKLSDVLTIEVANLDATRNITSYGLDSLTAIELRNWIAKELRANLQILELLSSGTVNDLAAIIVQKTRHS
ncbi:acyl transferase domain-containing protein [Copromyces sp. CBS 386.78]|nr:acyl transferase domain-containing protein [Copromyces sp. CBS 386.78]